MNFRDVTFGEAYRDPMTETIWLKIYANAGAQIGTEKRLGGIRSFADFQQVDPVTLKVDDGTPDPKTAAELARMIGEFRTARKDLLAVISLKTNNGKFSKEFDAETEWVISGRFPKPVTFGDLKTGEPFGIPGVDRSALCKIEQGHAMNLAGVVGARCGFMDSITVTRLTWREVADILEGAKEKVNG